MRWYTKNMDTQPTAETSQTQQGVNKSTGNVESNVVTSGTMNGAGVSTFEEVVATEPEGEPQKSIWQSITEKFSKKP